MDAAASTTPSGIVFAKGLAIGSMAPVFSLSATVTLPPANSAREANSVPAGRKTMKEKKTAAMNPNAVYAVYSTAWTLKTSSAASTIKIATTTKFRTI